MRPPEFTGGNSLVANGTSAPATCFNEAAGIHRRKLWEEGMWRADFILLQ